MVPKVQTIKDTCKALWPGCKVGLDLLFLRGGGGGGEGGGWLK